MIYTHILLVLSWICFGIIHSFLAIETVKNRLMTLFSLSVRGYRILYNICATVTLGLLLYYQYAMSSQQLFEPGFFTIALSVVLLGAGLAIMWISIRKYFAAMSGIYKDVQQDLETNGLHQYVRHPLYLGTILFSISLFLIWPQLKNLLAVSIIYLYTMLGIILEERKLTLEFGERYEAYRKNVPMLLPRLIKRKK